MLYRKRRVPCIHDKERHDAKSGEYLKNLR